MLKDIYLPSHLWINGRACEAASGEQFDCLSPRDGKLLVRVAEGGKDDIDMAVQAARSASDTWARQAPKQRRRHLLQLADIIESHQDELAFLESLDTGKPITHARRDDLPLSINCLRFYAEAIDKHYDEIAPTASDVLATIRREPLGVIGAVVPWNFPLMIACWKLAPALAAGNTVVLKPAEQSPLTAIRLAELASAAGLPDGVINVVPGYGKTAGAALGRHPDVDAVSFTGSGPVGRLFLRYAAESNMKAVFLECGGKSPQIVFDDADDLDKAAQAVAQGICYNQGQVCSAGSRLLVQQSIADDFIDRVLSHVDTWSLGDPLDPATKMGALIESKHLERVQRFVDIGHAEGAALVSVGNQHSPCEGGFYFPSTIFDHVQKDMTLAQEEIFGPVLAVTRFADEAEALELANATRFGLAAAVWTSSLSRAHRMSRDLKAGTVWVNNYDGSDITVPFGGFGESGNGRDKSLHALDKMSQLKSTWIQF
ncbi:aldehyde dehydrogenase [Litchfieldella rifensis]|uniref:Aldehyde dehydrogenase n=1 Tax=Litchfieldella rifensis TaxID=762643 RepID=A0ABV7LTS3_9GAMM